MVTFGQNDPEISTYSAFLRFSLQSASHHLSVYTCGYVNMGGRMVLNGLASNI